MKSFAVVWGTAEEKQFVRTLDAAALERYLMASAKRDWGKFMDGEKIMRYARERKEKLEG